MSTSIEVLEKMVKELDNRIAVLEVKQGIPKPKRMLKDLQAGDKFSLAGHNWIALEHDEEGTLVVTAECVEEMPFDDREDYHNSFRSSTVREYLNVEFFNSLIDSGEVKPEEILLTPWDLTSSDGVDRYGKCEDNIGLLSENQYKAHKEHLILNDWWWLITPYASYARRARSVASGGTLGDSYAYNGRIGVRPALRLVSEILVGE